eukprot:4812891-Amphidinium_carterae.2
MSFWGHLWRSCAWLGQERNRTVTGLPDRFDQISLASFSSKVREQLRMPCEHFRTACMTAFRVVAAVRGFVRSDQ